VLDQGTGAAQVLFVTSFRQFTV